MVSVVRVGCIVLAAVGFMAVCGSVAASDLPAYDGPMDEGPTLHHYASAPCYIRGDIAYSAADGGSNGAIAGEVGGGCRIGNRGLRAEIVAGLRGPHDVTVNTGLAAGAARTRSSVTSKTVMLNAHYDFRNWYGVTAYVGAGIGLAHNRVDDRTIAQNALGANRLHGDDATGLAWSLMTGAAYQLSPHATLDLGYRYIDLGDAQAATVSANGNVLARANSDTLSRHEIKVGIRYNFPLFSSW